MALIDRMIQAIYKYGAKELILASGEKVTLAIGESRRPVSAEAATRQQVELLLREITPAHLAPEVGRDGNHEFSYASPSGAVQVRVERGAGMLRVRALPAISDDGEAPGSESVLAGITASADSGPGGAMESPRVEAATRVFTAPRFDPMPPPRERAGAGAGAPWTAAASAPAPAAAPEPPVPKPDQEAAVVAAPA